MRISLEGDQLSVHFGSHHAVVREAVEAELVHIVESVFVQVEKRHLEAGTAAEFIVGDSCLFGRLHCGEEVIEQDAPAENGLEAVAERRIHYINKLFRHVNP